MDLWPFPYRFERERRNAWLAQSKKTKLDASLSNVAKSMFELSFTNYATTFTHIN